MNLLFKFIFVIFILLISFETSFAKTLIKVENEKFLNQPIKYYFTETIFSLGKTGFYTYSCISNTLIVNIGFSNGNNQSQLTSVVLPNLRCTVIKVIKDEN